MKHIAFKHAGKALRLSLAAAAFILLTTGAGFAQPVSFKKSKNFPVGVNPVFVATGDFDEDNEVDLAVVNNASENVAILLGDGDPATLGFTKPPPLNVGNSPQAAAVGDFNNDGHRDLAIANFSGDNVSIRLGNGDGTFTSVFPNLSPGNGPIFIAVGHFNGDSNLDLAVANHGSDNVSIFMGHGDGTFDPALNFAVGNQPVSIAVADFSGPADGNLDLAITNFGGKTVSILLGDGSGNFTPIDCRTGEPKCRVGGQPVSIVTGDFNGDGLPDLASANEVRKNVTILLRNPDVDVPAEGLFAAAKNFRLGQVPVSLTTADFNGDGALDLAAAHFPGNRLSVLLGNGDGTFGHRRSFSTPGGQFAIAADDFNGDGQPDLAVANGKLSVLINKTEFPVAPASITLTAPNGGETWDIGSNQDITWTSNGITTQKNNNVKIYISRNSGATWKILDRKTPNDGTKTWKVKGPAEPDVRIKVCSVNFPAICDTSNADFGIVP